MDANYMLACGIVWCKAADPEAGWELIEALNSSDPRLRTLAQTLLLENGQKSMCLLEDALASGKVSPEAAGPCMAEILQRQHARRRDGLSTRPHTFDASLC
jgi:hypothetical protein